MIQGLQQLGKKGNQTPSGGAFPNPSASSAGIPPSADSHHLLGLSRYGKALHQETPITDRNETRRTTQQEGQPSLKVAGGRLVKRKRLPLTGRLRSFLCIVF